MYVWQGSLCSNIWQFMFIHLTLAAAEKEWEQAANDANSNNNMNVSGPTTKWAAPRAAAGKEIV